MVIIFYDDSSVFKISITSRVPKSIIIIFNIEVIFRKINYILNCFLPDNFFSLYAILHP